MIMGTVYQMPDRLRGRWAGVDNAWVQEKLDTRKMLENGDESHLSSAPRMSLVAHFWTGERVPF